jgi:hypothetical protein
MHTAVHVCACRAAVVAAADSWQGSHLGGYERAYPLCLPDAHTPSSNHSSSSRCEADERQHHYRAAQQEVYNQLLAVSQQLHRQQQQAQRMQARSPQKKQSASSLLQLRQSPSKARPQAGAVASGLEGAAAAGKPQQQQQRSQPGCTGGSTSSTAGGSASPTRMRAAPGDGRSATLKAAVAVRLHLPALGHSVSCSSSSSASAAGSSPATGRVDQALGALKVVLDAAELDSSSACGSGSGRATRPSASSCRLASLRPTPPRPLLQAHQHQLDALQARVARASGEPSLLRTRGPDLHLAPLLLVKSLSCSGRPAAGAGTLLARNTTWPREGCSGTGGCGSSEEEGVVPHVGCSRRT